MLWCTAHSSTAAGRLVAANIRTRSAGPTRHSSPPRPEASTPTTPAITNHHTEHNIALTCCVLGSTLVCGVNSSAADLPVAPTLNGLLLGEHAIQRQDARTAQFANANPTGAEEYLDSVEDARFAFRAAKRATKSFGPLYY